ncbi:NADH dehydrogenase [ubiquinone] 1 alpha subcomplex assembly factor 3 [Pristis pectinata]|uniref:NADH dehydrogenase [ubiquinone] 1 alpha subcomplex assembly factor 3 n=1 Tax=Pristis pectinata TaxID=685728 RepID=UPI00223DD9F4|nr:NADH dehydrogenase [ubiquinone] 1 alpha subcomplex assembly factor 3 [Pristis pectinata]
MAALCRVLRTCRVVGRPPGRGHRTTPADDERLGRTAVRALERGPDSLLVDGFSGSGFTVGGIRVLGPCALLPPACCTGTLGVTETSLRQSGIVLLTGTQNRHPGAGAWVTGCRGLDPKLLRFMRSKGVALEVTGHGESNTH